MNIVDIDPCVVQPKELDNTINRKLMAKGIHLHEQDQEWSANGILSARQLRNQLNKIYRNYREMSLTWEIHEQPFVSHRPFVGKLIVFCKRAIRKLTRWLIYPYIAQIMNFHSATIGVIEKMIELQEQLVRMEEAREK